MRNKKLSIMFLCGFILGLAGFFSTVIIYKNIDNDEIVNEEDNYISNVNNIMFLKVSDSINLGDMPPTLDKFGINNHSFDFIIKNISNEMLYYSLKLVDDQSTILNKMIRYRLMKNDVDLGINTLSNDGVIDLGKIDGKEEISYSLTLWLDYNSDVKTGTLNKKISVEEGSYFFDQSKASPPELVDNLIPVYYDDETMSYYKSDTSNEYLHEWYNYEKKMWANAVTVNEEKREYYLNSLANTRIEMNDINAFFVWIPRFNYDGGIKFVSKNENAYPAFTFNNNELNGFWISKYEAGLDENDLCISLMATGVCNNSNEKLLFKPNLPMLNRITMANLFYAIRKMELKNNIYGFNNDGNKLNDDGTIVGDSNNLDLHMVKNSEWNALVLLSESKYGNKEILPNNTFISGMAYYDKKDFNYNLEYGMKASTTGNITGVYDLVGGKREYVMLNNHNSNIFDNKSNSGFTSVIKEYYYDNSLNIFDKKLILNDKEYVINDEPVTRGGYKKNGDIYSYYGSTDYVGKVSLETNSRAVLLIGGNNNG